MGKTALYLCSLLLLATSLTGCIEYTEEELVVIQAQQEVRAEARDDRRGGGGGGGWSP